MVNPFEELAQAIILQAGKDYRQIGKRMLRKPNDPKLQGRTAELEDFFLSSWFAELTSLNGRRLLQQLQAEVNGMEGET